MGQASGAPDGREAPFGDAAEPNPARAPWRIKTAALLSSGIAVALGLAPHVLHHAAPIAGAALLAGTGGTMLFGVIGLVASQPFLLRVHRRSGGWGVPAALLTLFAVGFAVSTLVIGPAIRGDDPSSTGRSPEGLSNGHDTEHH